MKDFKSEIAELEKELKQTIYVRKTYKPQVRPQKEWELVSDYQIKISRAKLSTLKDAKEMVRKAIDEYFSWEDNIVKKELKEKLGI